MATRTIRVCDTCEATADVETYEIKSGDRRAKLDLCGEHGAPLAELLAAVPAATATPVDDAAKAERAAKRKAARERRSPAKATETADGVPAVA